MTMKLHQLQFLQEFDMPTKADDCVVFDKKKLSKLYARIQELHEETLELHAKYKYVYIYVYHTYGKYINNKHQISIMRRYSTIVGALERISIE